MDTIILALPGAERLAETLGQQLHCAASTVEMHRFPDGEAVVRLRTSVAAHRVLLVAHLDHPDEKTLPLVFAADAARELGAASIGLVAPYLPYMRQDERFKDGEAVTSKTYARLLSSTVDFVLTIDPHLHRWPSLDAVYTVPAQAVPAAPAIAAWLQGQVQQPILVGPDMESEQWVKDVAQRVGAPWFVMTKVRRGDRDVQVRMPDGVDAAGRTPVLLDDIISSGHTMAAAAQVLRGAGWPPALCIGVHALLDGVGLDLLHRCGIARVASCDTVPHPTNAIPVAGVLAERLRQVLA